MSGRQWRTEPPRPDDRNTCAAPGCTGPTIAILAIWGGGLPEDRTPMCPTHLREFRAGLATGEPNDRA